MTTQLDTTIDKLKSSPLFYLFLSSRELFHTNFWYWLSTLNPEETVKLFGKFVSGNLNFKREHNQRSGEYKSKIDLLISKDDSPFIVIENKVKDLPTNEQLHRIKQSFSNDNKIYFILTTLFLTSDIKFDGWTIIKYQELSDSIKPDVFTKNSYFQKLIEDYKQFSNNLAQLAASLPIEKNYDFAISFQNELYEQLNEIKLWESFQKLRSSHLLYHYKPVSENIKKRDSIHHQKATMDFFFLLPNNYEIGIQIENTQFRRFVSGKSADEFAKNLMRNNIFFDKNYSKGFLKYGDTFRYQYTTIGTTIPFSELFERIDKVLKDIKESERKIKNNIPGKQKPLRA